VWGEGGARGALKTEVVAERGAVWAVVVSPSPGDGLAPTVIHYVKLGLGF
jgi:hypothetical protein